ncbi:NAD(P)H-quinone oxidoreductase [Asticcacaulis tiandongensis]|uniref:NAD(P)H-quinone oxidoreductase n=1 Tax=Asticcacaulis tiandongensis TaxID=2565365 RepID=UPI001126864E|nr:NAD(P)H-quinone oxidoreductase [Asticcacaulis tiandongensis]
MRIVAVQGDGKTAASLFITEAALPQTEAGDVLLRVTHAGVNRPDILQRQGLYPPPAGASPVLGLEVAGVIETIHPEPTYGDDVLWKTGDLVCALVNGGGYADYVRIDARHLLPIPEGWSPAEAAALPEVCLTVYANLIEHGGLKAGETVLVHGANSGIGAMTVQMAKAFGAQVIATVRGAERMEWITALGADLVIDTQTEDFVAPAKAFGGADVVLDIIAGDYTAKNILCLNPKGRIVQVGMARGSRVEIDLARVMQKQAVITGSMLRPRSADEKARLVSEVRTHVWPHILSGRIRPLLDKVFDFPQVAAAHEYLDSGTHTGKVVLAL